jgi:hypothetical protein
MKGSFIVPTLTKDPFIKPTVMKGSFVARVYDSETEPIGAALTRPPSTPRSWPVM